jgi:glucose-1-phosphate thymidylyltransferase
MREIVGLLPAAGRGSRLGPIPCSKEIMPLGFQPVPGEQDGVWRPVTAIETHLRAFGRAGVRRAAVIISELKHDIVRYLGNGERYGLSLTYLFQQQLGGMPFALQLAEPWLADADVLFAMPDTLITPDDVAQTLVNRHRETAADLTLGLFATDTPYKFGMVELRGGQVTTFIDKPQHSTLELMWGTAVWSPRFTLLLSAVAAQHPSGGTELVLSDVFAAALAAKFPITPHILGNARYRDIGTPEDFQRVVHELATQG